MPRHPRIFVADIPSHIIARGNNRNACFFCDEDYLFYLSCLNDACIKYRVFVHSYVLMTNHVHLLLTPSTADAIPKAMQSIGRRYVQYINQTYNRSGTLWEGRYKASIIDAESYFLSCSRYIELNPVRANMVKKPVDYRWSSYAVNCGYKERKNLVEHDIYSRLGLTYDDRTSAYRELFKVDLTNNVINNIQQASKFSMPLGSLSFQKQISESTGRKVGHQKRGRPYKHV